MTRHDRPWGAIRERGSLAVLLVRHGQTEWNASGRFLGVTDIDLDPIGESQARELSLGLSGQVDHVYSSPLTRARRTAAALSPEARVVEALRELDQGQLEGLEAPVAFARFPEFFAGWAVDPGSVAPPGGESLRACQDRMLGALSEVGSTHRGGEVIALVSHQLAIAAALCGLTGSPLASWRRHRLPNCGVSVLAWNGKTWTIEGHGIVVNNLGTTGGSGVPDV